MTVLIPSTPSFMPRAHQVHFRAHPMEPSETGQPPERIALASEPPPTQRPHWLEPLEKGLQTIQRVVHQVLTVVRNVMTWIRHLDPRQWWQPEHFIGQDQVQRLPGERTPQQAAQELAPAALGLTLMDQPTYQTGIHPIEKGLRRVLTLVNTGTPDGLTHAPAAVLGVFGQTDAPGRFVQLMRDVAFDGQKRSVVEVDLSQAQDWQSVVRQLNSEPKGDTPRLVYLSHADLASNPTMDELEKRQILTTLKQLVSRSPDAETDTAAQTAGLALKNDLLVIGLDQDPLTLGKSSLDTSRSLETETARQQLSRKLLTHAPYWQTFSAQVPMPFNAGAVLKSGKGRRAMAE